ncbi:hypothetical protein SAMN05421831_11917 [Allopseudospirillum japonicum]|uniref:YheU family protein n=1 Tax=Allopseudospirillum japonicum TaxID=64971 RepID=A0A1H6ULF6_9GAMM|nr:YheU family protein [Allopseudospirillum japonicum]SEI92516.1 hypothetical protein SAMN05421831_11917 [Allopseudospirillum japonicum]
MSAIEIPYQTLSSEALQGVLEDFVTRQGYDTTTTEENVQDWVQQVQHALKRGELVLVMDTQSQTPTLLKRQDYQQLIKS